MKSAEVLHESGQHLDAIFNYQHALELMLKAMIHKLQGTVPPKTHDLLALTEILSPKVAIESEQMKIINELHDVSVPIRYPDDLDEALAAYSYGEVKRIGEETSRLLQWLRQKLN